MLEKWKVIEEERVLKDAYLISNKGRIKMRTRVYYTGTNKSTKRVIKGGFMKPSITAKKYTSNGYYAQPLRCVDGSQRTFFVHRLVAKYFLKNWDENLTVNHIDENSLNNDITNLEMMSMKDNVNYGSRTQRALSKRKSNEDKRQIKPLVLTKGDEIVYIRSIRATADYLGVGVAKVRSCLKGDRNTVKGWEIKEQ